MGVPERGVSGREVVQTRDRSKALRGLPLMLAYREV